MGIPNGTTISAAPGATTVTLSQLPSGSGVINGETLYFGLPLAGATVSLNNAILPRVTIGGTAWATAGANGLTAFTTYTTSSDVTNSALLAAPTAVLQVNRGRYQQSILGGRRLPLRSSLADAS